MISDLYQKDLLRIAARAAGDGRLEDADGSARADNPMCGDRVTMDVKLADGAIAAVGHEVKACILCQASASLIGENAPGRSAAEIDTVAGAVEAMLKNGAEAPGGDWRDFAAFDGVRPVKSRHTCVLLPFQALREALAKATA